MDTNTAIILVVLVILLAVIGAALFMMNRRRANLRDRFGPEYARAVEESGGRRQAEAELRDRKKRVEAFSIRPLDRANQSRYVASWRKVQAEFVDAPQSAVSHAEQLLDDIMTARGYPVSDFEQRSADLSVDHPVVVQNYRAAREIALRHGRGEAGTEDLRQAMIHYRALFDDLVGEPTPVRKAS